MCRLKWGSERVSYIRERFKCFELESIRHPWTGSGAIRFGNTFIVFSYIQSWLHIVSCLYDKNGGELVWNKKTKGKKNVLFCHCWTVVLSPLFGSVGGDERGKKKQKITRHVTIVIIAPLFIKFPVTRGAVRFGHNVRFDSGFGK